jgi:two-component system, sensor histidine kinase and response regulator
MGTPEELATSEEQSPLITRRTLSEAGARSRGRVLVAEDNPTNQEVAVGMLGLLGYEADVAKDGLEVLEALQRGSYAAVLMDVQMPKMDGYEATAEIRHREEGKGHHTPIVAMTANALRGDREKTLEAGMDDYVSKPVNSEELREVLGRWIPQQGVPQRGASEKGTKEPAQDGAPAGEESPLDERVLANLNKVGPEFLSGLARIFLRDTPPQLASLEEAIRSCDWDAVKRICHALKGSCSAVGSPKMARICADLREAGTAEDPDGALGLVGQLEEEYARVRPALEAYLNTS